MSKLGKESGIKITGADVWYFNGETIRPLTLGATLLGCALEDFDIFKATRTINSNKAGYYYADHSTRRGGYAKGWVAMSQLLAIKGLAEYVK